MAKHSIRREIVGLSNHEKISEIAVTVAEKKLVVSNLGLNGTFQKRRDTNIENRTKPCSDLFVADWLGWLFKKKFKMLHVWGRRSPWFISDKTFVRRFIMKFNGVLFAAGSPAASSNLILTFGPSESDWRLLKSCCCCFLILFRLKWKILHSFSWEIAWNSSWSVLFLVGN